MASDWESTELQYLIQPGRGISYGVVQPGAEVSDGIPIVRVSDIREGRISTANPLKVSPAVEANYARTRLRGGELLLTLVGTVGETAIVPKELQGWNTARAVGVIPVNDEVGAYWAQLVLNMPEVRERIGGRLNTTVQATLNLRDVAELPIILPPRAERKRIEHILGTLQDKIELNRKMNETLEAMARALFKSWFVDFDPARAKAEGRDTGLPAPIAALFPDSFEDSELGEIPTGWSTGTLANFALLNPESWTKNTRPRTIRYVDLGNTKWGRIESVTQYSEDDAPSRAQRVLRDGDTIVGTVRPGNGSYALVNEDGLTGSTGFAVLRPQKPEYREYIYLAATVQENIDALAHLADGGAYPAIRPEAVTSKSLVRPPDEVVAHFGRAVGVSLVKIALKERESQTLAALRDTLLPKLISGELRVPETAVKMKSVV
jgi:type I restriction enzyme S subunit